MGPNREQRVYIHLRECRTKCHANEHCEAIRQQGGEKLNYAIGIASTSAKVRSNKGHRWTNTGRRITFERLFMVSTKNILASEVRISYIISSVTSKDAFEIGKGSI